MRLRHLAALGGAALAFALGASPAWAADALVGRWEFVTPAGAPVGGAVYDFVAKSPTTFTNTVVRDWPFNCGTRSGDINLTRISAQGAQPAYRGTHAVRFHLSPCNVLRTVDVELVIRPDGMALMAFQDGSGLIQHFKRRSVEVGQLSLSYRDRIDRAIRELRPTATKLGRRWNALQAEIAEQSATATKLLDTSVEQKGIRKLERQLADYRDGLERLAAAERRSPNNAGLSAIRAAWQEKVQALRADIGKLRTAIGKKHLRRLATEKALQDAVAERGRVDARLTDVARRLSPYDFEVSEVAVTAGSELVFRARVNTVRARALERIEGKLARLRSLLASLEEGRAQAKAEFLRAQSAVTAAGERISTVIWQNVAAGFATDVAFLALDLGIAAVRGGFIGVAAEVAKKTAETAAFAIRDVLAPSAKPSEGSVEDDLRELYGAKVKELFTADAPLKVAAERGLKETQFKILVKDPATDYLKRRVFDPFTLRMDFTAASAAIAAEPNEANLRRVEKTVKALLEGTERLEDFARRQRTKPGTLRGLAESVTKDVVKLAIKKTLDARELEAWIDYFEKDIYARGATAQFRAASGLYWDVRDMTEELEAERRRQLDSPHAEKVLVSKPFSHGVPLRIQLKGRGRPGELNVYLGGERATPLGNYAYQLLANADRADSGGKVLLEVR